MKRYMALVAVILSLPALSCAQAARLALPNLDHLSKVATESVDINLDGALLQTAGRFAGATAGATDPGVGEVLKGLQGIYIKSFKFDKPGMYSQNDVEFIRRQITDPGWSKLISSHSASKGEDVDIFMRKDAKDGGLLILAAKPLEFTIVNIVGNVDMEKLRQLQGSFGVPKLADKAPAAPATER